MIQIIPQNYIHTISFPFKWLKTAQIEVGGGEENGVIRFIFSAKCHQNIFSLLPCLHTTRTILRKDDEGGRILPSLSTERPCSPKSLNAYLTVERGSGDVITLRILARLSQISEWVRCHQRVHIKAKQEGQRHRRKQGTGSIDRTMPLMEGVCKPRKVGASETEKTRHEFSP